MFNEGFERAVERGLAMLTGKWRSIDQIRGEPLPHRTEEEMNDVPPDEAARKRYFTHREIEEQLAYALRS